MTPALGLLLAAVCTAIAIAAAMLLTARMLVLARSDERAGTRLPWPMRLCRAPALLLEPVVQMVLPASQEQRVAHVLDSLGFYPRMTPALWLSSRWLHGVAAALLAGAFTGFGSVLPGLAFAAGFASGGVWLRRLRAERDRHVTRELPAYLDLLTVCVEAGATLTAGVRLIVAQAPPSPLRGYFDRVLREVRGGRPRSQAFAQVAAMHGVDSLVTLAQALGHAEAAGMSLGQILRAQSEQRTAERFARAERLAMQAPVKMLGPLILCIFPCTFIVLAVPITVRMMEVFRA